MISCWKRRLINSEWLNPIKVLSKWSRVRIEQLLIFKFRDESWSLAKFHLICHWVFGKYLNSGALDGICRAVKLFCFAIPSTHVSKNSLRFVVKRLRLEMTNCSFDSNDSNDFHYPAFLQSIANSIFDKFFSFLVLNLQVEASTHVRQTTWSMNGEQEASWSLQRIVLFYILNV